MSRKNRVAVQFTRICITLLALWLLSLPAYGIGLSPVDIIADDVLPNSQVKKELHISRVDASKEAIAIIQIEGEAAQYITMPLGPSITIPAGENTFTYPLIIEPGSLAGGTYQAKITVVAQNSALTTADDSSPSVTAGTSIQSGAQITLTFTVTNKTIEQYSISAVEMASSEENQLIGFSFTMLNTGNVDTRPAKIEFTAIDELDPDNTYSEIITADRIKIVPAFTEEVVTVLTQGMLTTGLYNVSLAFYNAAEEVIYVSDTLRLQIFPEGTLDQKGELTTFITDKLEYQVAEPVLFEAHFTNIGQIGVNAELVLEIIKDGTRIDILNNEPVFVPVNQTATLQQDFKPAEGGSYIASAAVNYGIFTTEKKDVAFEVKQLNNLIVFGFIGIFLAGSGIITGLIYRRKKNTLKKIVAQSSKKKDEKTENEEKKEYDALSNPVISSVKQYKINLNHTKSDDSRK